MLLFAPLALFFIVAVIDVGMSFRDRSGIIDATRSAVNAHPANIAILRSFDPQSGFDNSEQNQFLAKIAQEIDSGIKRSRSDHNINAAQQPYIHVALVKMSIDPQLGTVTSSAIVQPDISMNNANFEKCGDADLGTIVSERVNEGVVSSFALPVANVFDGGAARYLPYSYLLAAQVCSRAIGIGGESSQAIAGRFFDFHDEQVLPLRIQPNTLW